MLNEKLRKIRNELGLTQEDVAKKIGVTRSAYTQYETGKRSPDLETLKLIARTFNVSIDFLLDVSSVETAQTTNTKLTPENKKDIAKQMDTLRETLENSEGLMFNGDELNDETKDLLLALLEKDIETATITNKKYTPKKYRK